MIERWFVVAKHDGDVRYRSWYGQWVGDFDDAMLYTSESEALAVSTILGGIVHEVRNA